ncbi:fibronectin type III domain-containing protein [Leucobacter sp. HY1908]
MPQIPRRALTACAAIPLALLLALPGTANAVPSGPDAPDQGPSEPAPSVTGSGLGDAVVAAVAAGATTESEIAAEVSVAPSTRGGGFSYDAEGRLRVMVLIEAGAGAAEQLIGDVAVVAESLAPVPGVAAWVAPERMQELASIEGIASVSPTLTPMNAGAMQAAPVTKTAPVKQADSCGPVPIEADIPLDSAEARELFGVDGTGVTVGIISDSFNRNATVTTWADDVASGALPGPDNPCGYTTPVEVLSDETEGGSDEGRGMAQLVHGIAPGAKLMFADYGTSDVGMAESIEKLAEAGADIIVDDILYMSEPYYQRGFISQTVEQVKEDYGVMYLAAAANMNGVASSGPHAGDPVGSWQTTKYRATTCPAWVTQDAAGEPLPAGADCLDFDPDPAVDQAYDTLQMRSTRDGSSVAMQPLASIGEPIFGVTTSYELQFYEAGGAEPKLLAAIASMGGGLGNGNMLYPGLVGEVIAPSGSEVYMVMVRKSFEAGSTPAVYLGTVAGAESIASRQFMGNRELGAAATDWVGESTFGHLGDGTALSVASAHWDEPTKMRYYSSLGPNTLLFEGVAESYGANPAPRLPAPQIVSSPQVTSVDGTLTTFFGENSGTPSEPEYRFYGTSAAAPNAAAVAALAKQQAPAIGQAELSDLLRSTARGTADGGPVNPYTAAGFEDTHVFGTGLVSATRLLEALPERPATPGELQLKRAEATSLDFTWAPVDRAEALTVELYAGAGDSPAGVDTAGATPVATVELAGDAVAHSFTGLTSNTGYTVRLVAEGSQGALAEASLGAHTKAEAPAELAVAKTTDRTIAVSWVEHAAPDHYLVRAVPVAQAVAMKGDMVQSDGAVPGENAQGDAPTAGLVAPVELNAGSTGYEFTALAAGTEYEVIVEAVNTVGVSSSATVKAKTQGPKAAASGTAGANKSGLAHTGGNDLTPLLVGGGVLLVLAAAALLLVQLRRRRRATSAEGTDESTARDTAGDTNSP